MPLFTSHHSPNRLRKALKTGDEGTTGKTRERRRGVAAVQGGTGDPKSSLGSFTTVSNSSSTHNPSTTSVNIQRSESTKRRFGLNSILTRGKNRTDTGQGSIVSSQAADMRHQAAGLGPMGELGAGSKDGTLPETSALQQTPAATLPLGRTPSRKLTKLRPNKDLSAPVLSLPPEILPVPSLPAKFSQQQHDSMAATATMNSVMQQSKRRSFSLTYTVDELPHQATQAPSSLPVASPQTSRFNPSQPAPSLVNRGPSSMQNTYSSRPLLQNGTSDPVNIKSSLGSSGTIGTPLGYYITPSQTPTLPDRSDMDFKSPPVPTVVRPGPSTPPLTESSVSLASSVTKVTILTSPTPPQNQLQLAIIPSIPIPEVRPFNNGPLTPASSNSSEKERDPSRRVDFPEEAHTPTGSIKSVGSYTGGNRPSHPQQNRFGNYRPPPLGRPVGSHSRSYGPNRPPHRGPPRGNMLIRAPPRPPSPIYVSPPDMKHHKWQPLRPGQLECSMGHNFLPFRNKQHSILCSICRSMEAEGRGQPVKRNFYCSWCAIRMCGTCKEELMGGCQGSLAELWDRTEEKRRMNMERVRDGKILDRVESVVSEEQKPSDESFGSRWTAAAGPVDNQKQIEAPPVMPSVGVVDATSAAQENDPREQPQRQLTYPQPQARIPKPQQPRIPQSQQPRIPQSQQPRIPQSQQPRIPQSQQPRIPQSQQPRIPQSQQPRIPQSQQSRIPQSQQSRTQSQQLRIPQLPLDRKQALQKPHQLNSGPPLPEKPQDYLPPSRRANRSDPRSQPHYPPPPPVPQLTAAETERYRLVTVPSNQKPPQSSTVVLVGEKPKEPSIFAASLKGSTKKKRNWLRGFGKRREA